MLKILPKLLMVVAAYFNNPTEAARSDRGLVSRGTEGDWRAYADEMEALRSQFGEDAGRRLNTQHKQEQKITPPQPAPFKKENKLKQEKKSRDSRPRFVFKSHPIKSQKDILQATEDQEKHARSALYAALAILSIPAAIWVSRQLKRLIKTFKNRLLANQNVQEVATEIVPPKIKQQPRKHKNRKNNYTPSTLSNENEKTNDALLDLITLNNQKTKKRIRKLSGASNISQQLEESLTQEEIKTPPASHKKKIPLPKQVVNIAPSMKTQLTPPAIKSNIVLDKIIENARNIISLSERKNNDFRVSQLAALYYFYHYDFAVSQLINCDKKVVSQYTSTHTAATSENNATLEPSENLNLTLNQLIEIHQKEDTVSKQNDAIKKISALLQRTDTHKMLLPHVPQKNNTTQKIVKDDKQYYNWLIETVIPEFNEIASKLTSPTITVNDRRDHLAALKMLSAMCCDQDHSRIWRFRTNKKEFSPDVVLFLQQCYILHSQAITTSTDIAERQLKKICEQAKKIPAVVTKKTSKLSINAKEFFPAKIEQSQYDINNENTESDNTAAYENPGNYAWVAAPGQGFFSTNADCSVILTAQADGQCYITILDLMQDAGWTPTYTEPMDQVLSISFRDDDSHVIPACF